MRLEARGLRARLAAALTVFSAAAAALLAVSFWAGEAWLERDSARRLEREAAGGAADAQATVAYTEDLAQSRRYWLVALLFTGTGVVAGVAWWLSGRIVRHGLQPLADLVTQIRGIDLERRNHRLALGSADPDLQVIVAALNAHMAQLDALVERERAFAAAASHELRTPLSVIGGAAAVLAQSPQVPPNVLARIERAVEHARQDLEALLALSRGAAAAASPQRLDQLLPQLAAVHLDAHANPATRVSWDVTGPVERTLAPGPLSIVFGNLLRNALRAAAGGDVRIAVDADSLSITDNGPGLPPELLRGDAIVAPAARRDGGSGLGLYIARTLAQREGWTLALGAAEGGGARAELRFGGQGRT